MRTYQRRSKHSIDDKAASKEFTAPQMMTPCEVLSFAWLDDLEVLTNRYAELGLQPDIASLSPPDVFRVYAFLKRHDHEQRGARPKL